MPCDNTRGTRHDQFHAAARSRHPGGVNAVFADGHVIFTSDTIDLVIWQRLAAIDDGQVIPAEFLTPGILWEAMSVAEPQWLFKPTFPI